MATNDETDRMQNRGLLTEDDRAFFRGEKETDDPDKTRREKLFNVRERRDNVAEDLELLREAGEDETVEQFYAVVGRYERLERQLHDLQSQLDE